MPLRSRSTAKSFLLSELATFAIGKLFQLLAAENFTLKRVKSLAHLRLSQAGKGELFLLFCLMLLRLL